MLIFLLIYHILFILLYENLEAAFVKFGLVYTSYMNLGGGFLPLNVKF